MLSIRIVINSTPWKKGSGSGEVALGEQETNGNMLETTWEERRKMRKKDINLHILLNTIIEKVILIF